MKKFIPFFLIITIIVIFNSLFIVKQEETALVFQFGEAVEKIDSPGVHIKMPFIQDVKYFEKRILNFNLKEEEIQAQDKKRIIVSAFIKYKIIDTIKYYQSIGSSGEVSSRLYSILDSSLRQVIGQNPLIHLLSKERNNIMQKIQAIVSRKAERFGIEIIDLRILRADLPKENSQAIYRRMQSDREMEAREYRAQGTEEAERITSIADREVKIIVANAYKAAQIYRGDGDSKATKIYASIYNQDPDFYAFYKSLEVYKNSFTKNNTKLVISPDSGFMKYFYNIHD